MTHRGSHRDLLRPPRFGAGHGPDAVVVPTARPAAYLLPAMKLAAGLEVVLVALCSGAAKRREVAGLAREVPDLRCAVVPVPADYRHVLLDFRTSAVRQAQVGRLGDLSLKRNLGLLLGHLVGWRSLLFIDDDMEEIDSSLVRRAAAAITPGGAVGMPAERFPDNSVVCHANRMVSPGRQDVFVSGSALVVDCQHVDSFFPRVYNEDWLFLADALRRGAVSAVGTSTQLEYDPFASPERAAAEEFGDVLAEGLIGLLHTEPDRAFADAGAGYWEDFLVQRKQLIVDIEARADALDPGAAAAVRRSMAAAELQRSTMSGFALASYVRAWRADLASWRRRLRGLERGRPLPWALARLGLLECAMLSADPEAGQSAVTRRAPAEVAAG